MTLTERTSLLLLLGLLATGLGCSSDGGSGSGADVVVDSGGDGARLELPGTETIADADVGGPGDLDVVEDATLFDSEPGELVEVADVLPEVELDLVETLPQATPPGLKGPVVVEVLLETQLVTPDITIPYQLLKLVAEGGHPVYAQWFPPAPEEGVRPVMMVTRPYDGIDWSGDPVDIKWAERGPGAYPDDDEPGYGPGSSHIGYSTLPHEKAAEEALIYRVHKMGALFVYGRYYAGGSIRNEVDDMTTGLAFLAQQQNVDKEAVGLFGASWGGFEAVYAAAYAPPELTPAVGVALAPLVLMDQQVEYVTQTLPASNASPEQKQGYQAFFETYLRRIFASTGGKPDDPGADYSFWNAKALAQRTKTPFLLVHDQWDTLVPFVQSETLAQLNPAVFKPLFMYQESPRDFSALPMDHGNMLVVAGGFPAIYSVFYSFSLSRLLPDGETIMVLCHQPSMRVFFEALRSYQLASKDVSWAAPLLVDMAGPDVLMFDIVSEPAATIPGAQYVADELNAVWGLELKAEQVVSVLEQGLPE